MPKIKIDRNRCKGCKLCVIFCPKKLLETEDTLTTRGVQPVILKNEQECSGCRFCMLICPDMCIEIIK